MRWHNTAFLHSPAIGNAFAVLSNPEKRLRYDEFGSDQEHVSTGQARHYNYYTEFEADITPEEIFNVFFGGHFPTGWYLPPAVLKLILDVKQILLVSIGELIIHLKRAKTFLDSLLSPFLAFYAWKNSLNARFKLQIEFHSPKKPKAQPCHIGALLGQSAAMG